MLCYKGVNNIPRLIQQTNCSLQVFKVSVELFLTVLSKLQWQDKGQCINGICTVILTMMKQFYREVPTEYNFQYELKVIIYTTSCVLYMYRIFIFRNGTIFF